MASRAYDVTKITDNEIKNLSKMAGIPVYSWISLHHLRVHVLGGRVNFDCVDAYAVLE